MEMSKYRINVNKSVTICALNESIIKNGNYSHNQEVN